MRRIRRSTKALSVDIYERSDGRYHVVSKDETGGRHYATRLSLSDAKKLQSEKIAELQRQREGRFNLDDREMLSQARDLASSHGYTVLQAVQEWHSSKGSSKAMPLGEVIEKFLAAKSNRSGAYMDKLNADMRLFLSHFGADQSIDRIRSDEIEDFLDSKKAASRRRNNLRSEIITLFRYAQIRLRALHGDRKTEAELVLRDQAKRKPVETFSPNEFQTLLGVVRPEWLAWLALGGLAAYREVLSIDPHNADVCYNLAVLLAEQGRLQEAENLYNGMLLIHPEYVDAYNNLGVLLSEQGRWNEAEKVYNDALKVDPQYARAYYNLGVLLSERDRIEEAEKAYNELLKIDQQNADAFNNLGILLSEHGRIADAEKAYKEALKIDSEHPEAQHNLGILLGQQSSAPPAV